MRILHAALLAVTLAMATACDAFKDKNPSQPSPPEAGSTISYAPLGASDVMGIGSSSPCAVPFGACDGAGYPYVAARQLRSKGFTVDVSPLGLPGAVISRPFMDLAAQYGRTDVVWNLTQSGLPFIPRDATLVTVFTGANDVNVITSALGKGAGASNQVAFIDQQVAQFGSDFATLIDGVRSRASKAKIIVFNLPNLAGVPYLANASLEQKRAAQRASVQITTTVINTTQNVTVIDLMCDASFYTPAYFSSDGFHPNDVGYGVMANAIVSALTSAAYPAPKSSCGQMTLY